MAHTSHEDSMTPQDYRLIKDIVANAIDLSEEGQQQYIQKACQSTPHLIETIHAMLAINASDETEIFMESAIEEHMPDLGNIENHDLLKNGTIIKNYTIEKLLATGGMGNVYVAIQKFPAERKVALKLIKKIPNQQLLITETQILAQLNHPNIATLYQVDKLADGQLFIAMELIDGTDILSWINANNQDLKQRLKIFVQLCQGISYAHAKGIIHCDIKPNNILVTEENGNPTVKIIDFGISQNVNAQTDVIAGTPAYLAPEVLNNKDNEISDIRRDVYSLGILLRKILPLDRCNDLKAICDKATSHEKQHRYASANDMRRDINRFLNKRAVTARKPNFLYLTKLFIQRRYGVVLFSVILLFSLIGGFIAQSIQARKAEKQAQAAKIAQLEAEKLSDFLTDMFNMTNPEKSQGTAITTDDLLHKARTKLLTLKNPTLSDAKFIMTVGSIYNSLDKLPEAKLMIEKALKIRQAKLPKNHPDIIECLSQLGLLNRKMSQFKQAEILLTEAIKLSDSQDNPDTEQLATIHNNLGNLYQETRQYPKAINQHKQAIQLRKNNINVKALAESYNNLGVVYNNMKNWDLSIHYYELALKVYMQEYDANHPYIAVLKNNLAYQEEKKYNWEKSEDLLSEAWIIWQFAYGENHRNTLIAQENLAKFYDRRMRYQKAIDLFKLMITSVEKNHNIEKQAKYSSLLGMSYAHLHDYDNANNVHKKAIELLNNQQIIDPYLFARVRTQFAQTLIAQSHYKQALLYLRSALDDLNTKFQVNDNYRLYTLNLIAEVLLKQKNMQQAQPIYNEVLGFESEKSKNIKIQLITAYLGQAKIKHIKQLDNEAKADLNKALSLSQTIYGEQNKKSAKIYYEIARLNAGQGYTIEAIEYVEKAIKIQSRALPSKHPDLMLSRDLMKVLNSKN